MTDLLLVLGISKLIKPIILDYQDKLDLMYMNTIFLSIFSKYFLRSFLLVLT
jgi:hypothetical protein